MKMEEKNMELFPITNNPERLLTRLSDTRDLEEAIKNFIECKYNCCFTGKVRITSDWDGMSLGLELNNWMAPTWIHTQLTDPHEFYTFITKEITKRNLPGVGYSKVILEDYGETQER